MHFKLQTTIPLVRDGALSIIMLWRKVNGNEV